MNLVNLFNGTMDWLIANKTEEPDLVMQVMDNHIERLKFILETELKKLTEEPFEIRTYTECLDFKFVCAFGNEKAASSSYSLTKMNQFDKEGEQVKRDAFSMLRYIDYQRKDKLAKTYRFDFLTWEQYKSFLDAIYLSDEKASNVIYMRSSIEIRTVDDIREILEVLPDNKAMLKNLEVINK